MNQSLSSQVWQISWDHFFPSHLGEGNLLVDVCSFDEAFDFLKSHAVESLPPKHTGFIQEEFTPQKIRYYQSASDCFLIFDGSRAVGCVIGGCLDWSTFYLRYVVVLPEYQGRGIWKSVLRLLLQVLSVSGVDRFEIETPSSNLIEVHLFNQLQFNLTGFKVSERWGTMAHFTKFLNKKNEKAYIEQLCTGIAPQLDQPAMEWSGETFRRDAHKRLKTPSKELRNKV